jgi:hypothetical protein
MTQDQLDKALDSHEQFLRTNSKGNRFTGALEDLRNLCFCGRELRGIDIKGADIRGSDFDYASWPLWCGSKDVTIDRKLLCQLAAHIGCTKVYAPRVRRSDPDYAAFHKQCKVVGRKSHRAVELGLKRE